MNTRRIMHAIFSHQLVLIYSTGRLNFAKTILIMSGLTEIAGLDIDGRG